LNANITSRYNHYRQGSIIPNERAMNSWDTEYRTASRCVVSTHLNLYAHSCVLKAIEAWRIWNEFPDQRGASEFVDALSHFGEIRAVMDDISIIMPLQLASPTPMFLDDSFILQALFGTSSSTCNSTFMCMCLESSLKLKFGDTCTAVCNAHVARRYYNSEATRCTYCKSVALMRDLGGYIARKRLQSL